MKIEARFTHKTVRFDQDQNTHLVLSLTAPSIDWQNKRPPICVVPAIDVSGSMAGTKMHYAKESVLRLIDHLQPTDRCGLVTFNSSVRVVSKVVLMTPENKDRLRQAVSKLQASGGTNFIGGLLEALLMIDDADLPATVLTRVITFTDGQANQGVAVDPEAMVDLMVKNLGRATVSAFGYGSVQDVNQELLSVLSEKGNGNYAHVQKADDALSAFGKELGGLLSTYAQNVRIALSPKAVHKIERVVSDVEVEEDDVLSDIVVCVPDMLAEETRHIVLAVKLGAQKQPFPRDLVVAEVKATFSCLDEQGRLETRTSEAKAKIRFVKPGEEQSSPTKDVDAIVALAQMTRAQKEAEALAKKGNFQQATDCLRVASANIGERGHAAIKGLTDNLSLKYGNQQAYQTSNEYRNSMSRTARRGMGVSGMSADVCRDYSVVASALNLSDANSAQHITEQLFTSGLYVSPISLHAPVDLQSLIPQEPPVEELPSVQKTSSKRLFKK